jgi:hypothetical protein
MKTARRQIFEFIFVGLLIFSTLYFISETVAPIYGSHKERMRLMRKNAPDIEAISAGNSHSLALDFETLNLRGFHLWSIGSDLFEVNYLLNAVVPLLPNLKVVLLNISPMAFGHDNRLTGGHNRLVQYAVTPTMRSWKLINGDVKNFVHGKLSPIIREDNWNGIVRAMIPIKSLHGAEGSEKMISQRVDQSGFIGNRMQNVVDAYDLQHNAERPRWWEKHDWNHPEIEEKAFHVLVSTIGMLRDKNIRVILYTPPITDVSMTYLLRKEPEAVQRSKSYVQRLQQEFHVEYFDFSVSQPWIRRYELFLDEGHLNHRGARLFSAELRVISNLDRQAGS